MIPSTQHRLQLARREIQLAVMPIYTEFTVNQKLEDSIANVLFEENLKYSTDNNKPHLGPWDWRQIAQRAANKLIDSYIKK